VFGWRRKDDEDPFAALKDGGTYQSPPSTVPTIGDTTTAPVASQPPAPPPPTKTFVPPSYGGRSRRSSFGWGTQVGFRLAAIATITGLAVGIPLLVSVHHASVPAFSVPSFNVNPETTPTSPTPAPVQTSYLTPHGLRAGLAHIEKLAPGARLSLLRLDDHSLSTTAFAPRGGSKLISFSPTGTFVTSTPGTGQEPVPISQIRPSVIARLLGEMRTRYHVPARRIDYIVLSSPQGSSPSWVIFTKAPSHPGYLATLSGAGLHRIA
jgi:hypothetical protein